MSELVKVSTDAGQVLFDSENLAVVGPQRVSRQGSNIVVQLDERLNDALATVRPAADAVMQTFRTLNPHELTVEFGLRVDAEAGAVIAKTSMAGHFTVTMKWSSGEAQAPTPE